MTTRPPVSVVIPAYNDEAFIGEAVDSVLAQDYRPTEVLVVDDGSTDATAEQVAGYGEPVHLLRRPHAGPAAARNAGMRASSGDFVAFLDADDIWLPGKLARSVQPFFCDEGVGVVYTDFRVREVDTGARYRLPCYRRGGWMARDLFLECRGVSTSSLVVRRTCLDRAGLFDEALFRAQDWDMIIRIAEICRYHFVPEVLLERRLHGGSLSARHADKYKPYNLRVIEKAAARRPDLYADLYPEAMARAYLRFGLARYAALRMRDARREFLRSLRYRPHATTLNYLARTLLPTSLVAALRRRRLRRIRHV